MGTGETNSFLIAVIIIPLVLLATLGVLYALERRLQRQMHAHLNGFRGELRQLQDQRRRLLLEAQAHKVSDPEPYGRRAAALHQRLDQVQRQIKSMERQRESMQKRMQLLSANRLRAIMGSPFYWSMLLKDRPVAARLVDRTRQAMQAAVQARQAIDDTSREVGQQALDLQQLQQQVSQLLGTLRERGLHGDLMETAIQQEKQARGALAQIPSIILGENETAPAHQIDKSGIASIHQVVEENRPMLDHLLIQTQAWEEQYSETAAQVAVLQRSLSALEQGFTSTPAEIDTSNIRAQFGQMKIIAQNLQDTLSRLEVESMGAVAQEAGRLTQAVQEMQEQLKNARARQVALEKILAELTGGLRQLSLDCAALASRAFPVAWDQSLRVLTDLNQQTSTIGPAKKSRDLDQLDHDLALVTRLNEQRHSLAQQVQQIAEQHGELTLLLSDPELEHLSGWLQVNRHLSAAAQEYAPENWPRLDAIGSLSSDLQSLEDEARRLLPSESASGSHAIPEAEVSARLQATRRLQESFRRLRKRMEAIQQRLQEMQNSEKQARQQLESAQSTLTQLAFIVRSSTFLTENAAPELARLQTEIQGLLDDLAQRQRGSLDKKARSAAALVERSQISANHWLDQLGQETQNLLTEISALLTSLDNIAQLQDPAIAEARRLLSNAGALGASSYAGKARYPLNELIAEFKRRSDYWQAGAAALNALDDVENPVSESYQQASQHRQQTLEVFADLETWTRQARSWPPTSISLEAERQDFDCLEMQWKSLRNEHLRAIQLVQQLGNLSAHYQSLAEKVRQGVERAEHERIQVQTIENEIEEYTQLWQSHLQTYRDEPEVAQEIRGFLNEAENELNLIHRQYQQGTKNYSQILQALNLLHRKLRLNQVALDADHALDTSGNVRRRR
ncbi:MAG: hypothetical protein JXB15_00530 [Anaerolineales bacterium]|nr:hypothetical protein [Anaerolineales bacterium]